MMLMRAKEKVLDPTFFMHVLNSPQTNQRVRQLTGGSASPHLNVQEIKRFPVPLPPFREQLEIVRRVEVLFKLANAIEKRVADATLRAKKLTAAILAKAFRGELVPTEAELARREGRPYESAADHLARIQSERTEKQSSSLKEKKWPIRSKRKIKSS
jgi:type I restriction enzyme S subunit